MKARLTSPASRPTGSLRQSHPSQPQHILVAEDDDDIRRLNTEVLIHHGYRVDATEDGAGAWNALQISPYDLLITDNRMPRMTGIELLRKLRAARLRLPVIMATGTPLLAEFSRHTWFQPAAVVLKPYTTDELLGVVRQVLHVTSNPHPQFVPTPGCLNF